MTELNGCYMLHVPRRTPVLHPVHVGEARSVLWLWGCFLFYFDVYSLSSATVSPVLRQPSLLSVLKPVFFPRSCVAPAVSRCGFPPMILLEFIPH